MKKALIQMHVAVLLWGFTGALGKLITLDAGVLVWYRMLISAIILALIITLQKAWPKIERKDWRKLLLIGPLFAIHWVFYFLSIKLANASIAMICLALASVIVAILDPFFSKTKMNITNVVIGIVAVFGVGVIYFFQTDDKDPNAVMVNFDWGVIFGIIAAVISAFFTLVNKTIAPKYKAEPLVFYEMFFGLIMLTILAPLYISYNNITHLMPTSMDWIWLTCLAVFCTVIAQSLVMSALKKLDPFTVTLSVNIEPVYGIIIAFIFLQENKQLNWATYVGMAIITIAVLGQMKMEQIARKKQLKTLKA